MTFEGPAKRGLGAIPQAVSYFARAHTSLAQPVPGEGHAPARQVLHGGHAHQPGEAFSKDRAGQVNLARQGGHRPGFLGASVHQGERATYIGISQRPWPVIL